MKPLSRLWESKNGCLLTHCRTYQKAVGRALTSPHGGKQPYINSVIVSIKNTYSEAGYLPAFYMFDAANILLISKTPKKNDFNLKKSYVLPNLLLDNSNISLYKSFGSLFLASSIKMEARCICLLISLPLCQTPFSLNSSIQPLIFVLQMFRKPFKEDIYCFCFEVNLLNLDRLSIVSSKCCSISNRICLKAFKSSSLITSSSVMFRILLYINIMLYRYFIILIGSPAYTHESKQASLSS